MSTIQDVGLVLALIAGIGVLYIGYYMVAALLLWPRLLAKALCSGGMNPPQRIRQAARWIIGSELALLLAAFFATYYYSPALFELVWTAVKVGAIGVFAFEVFVYGLFPATLGMSLAEYPPPALLREVGQLWAFPVAWVPAIAILYGLFIGSHVVGLAAMVLGIILAIRYRRLIPKDEDREFTDEYLKELKSSDQRQRIIAVLALGDIGGPASAQALAAVLQRKPPLREHIYAARQLARLRDPATTKKLLSVMASEGYGRFRDEVVGALSSIARVHPDEIVAALHHPLPGVRRAAGDALARAGWRPPDAPLKDALRAARRTELQHDQ